MKIHFFKTCLMFFIFSIIKTPLSAQTENIEWNVLEEQNNVIIYYAVGLCNNKETLSLKVENSSTTVIKAEFILDTNHIESVTNSTKLILQLKENEKLIIDCRNEEIDTIFQLPISNKQAFICSVKDLKITTQP